MNITKLSDDITVYTYIMESRHLQSLHLWYEYTKHGDLIGKTLWVFSLNNFTVCAQQGYSV